MPFGKGYDGNKGGEARWKRKPSSSDAGAPVSHAPLAARAPFPPPSVALITPPPPRCTRTGHCSRSRCFGRRDGDCWKSRHSTSASPTSPTSREATAAATPLPIFCTDAHGTHARTHNLQPTALWGRLPRRLRPHRSRRPHSSLRCRSGCCLPTAAPAPRMRTRTLDPAFDPAAAARVAVQSCRNG